jgi:hypothetical protein
MTHRMGWVLALAALGMSGILKAEAASAWQVQTSFYTTHFSPDPRHTNQQNLLAVERHRGDGFLVGGATFRNSFSQRSHYVYLGHQFPFHDTPFHWKLTGGLLHGYRGEYRDKIPLNRFGVAPAIIPSAGITHRQFVGEVVLLGAAATMVTAGLRF